MATTRYRAEAEPVLDAFCADHNTDFRGRHGLLEGPEFEHACPQSRHRPGTRGRAAAQASEHPPYPDIRSARLWPPESFRAVFRALSN